MPKYIIESFSGLSDRDSYGIKGSFKRGSKNLDVRKERDTLSCQQALLDETAPDGVSPSSSPSPTPSPSASQSPSASSSPSSSVSASPSQQSSSPSPSSSLSPSASVSPSSSASPSAAYTGFGTIIDWFVPASDGYIYGGGRNGKIFRRASGGVWDHVYTDTYGPILGMWEWGISNGKKYLFWATERRLNRKEIPGKNNWTDVNSDADWPKTNLSTARNHMMKGIGGGVGALAICNDETLALVGYDDSYTNEILRFTPGQQARVLLQRDNNLIIGTAAKNQLVQSSVFLWDGHDTEEVFGWDDMKPIPVNDILAMVDTEIPMVVDNLGRVFYSDFSTGLPIFNFPDNGVPVPGGVTTDSYTALFGISGNGDYAGVYTYGRKWKNAPLVLNLEYAIDCDEVGAVIKVGNDMLVSYRNGDYCGVKNIDYTTKATAVYISNDLPKPAKYPRQRVPVWGSVELELEEPLPSGCSISCKYRMNKTGSFKSANTRDGGTAFSTSGAQEAVFFIGDKGKVAEVELTLVPSSNNTPEVRTIDVWFD